mgnify:CR=1 FL=1
MKMLYFLNLKDSGYPLRANNLTIDEWLDLKNINSELIKIFNPKK